jgi:outer membrane protein assembly factor BamB
MIRAFGWLALALWSIPGFAADWPQWGGDKERDMSAAETHLAASFVPGRKKANGAGIDLATTQNVRWAVRLGTETYASPTVANGKVFIATNDRSTKDPRYEPTGGGLLMCVDATSGQLRWQLPVRRFTNDDAQSIPKARKYVVRYELGICSSPTVEGDRVYVVTNRGEVLCLDVRGLTNGNDGAYRKEDRYLLGEDRPPVKLQSSDPDIIWRFDMLRELPVFPHDANSCAILILGDVLYVGTANGVATDNTPYPDAPTLIALDKRTGRLIGRDDAKIGRRIFHGQWSSPSAGKVGDKTLVFYGGGDGICYAFEALPQVPAEPMTLKCVWSCDCNPSEYRFHNGKPIDYWDGDVEWNDEFNKNDGQYVGPSEIIATPAFSNNRVYVAIGRDPMHGRGKGALTCIDATRTGDITKTGKLWTYDGLERSLCTVAIADGLVYVADLAGSVHCVDAETGRRVWVQPTRQETWCSLLVADGKVYLGTKKAFWIMAAGREPRVLQRIHLGSPIWCPAIAANGVLYVASNRYLWAVQEGARGPMVASTTPSATKSK